jgi:hypothetical protein
MKSAFLEPRQRCASSFGTLARFLPGFDGSFTFEEVIDHGFKLAGRHPLPDSEQVAPSSHGADAPGDKQTDGSDDAFAWSVPSVLPPPHVFDIGIQKTG